MSNRPWRAYIARLTRVHDGLGGRPDGNRLFEILLTGLGHPSDLGGETLDVVLLLFQSSGRDEHGEVAVLDTDLLDLGIEPVCRDREKSGWDSACVAIFDSRDLLMLTLDMLPHGV